MPAIPSSADWGDSQHDPDFALIRERFAGKSNDDIQAQLKENFIMRSLDLSSMPDKPFLYYIHGFMDYVALYEGDQESVGFNIARLMDSIDSHFEERPELKSKFWISHPSFAGRISDLIAKLNSNSEIYTELSSRIEDVKGR
jgi:hypothetical protein